MRSLQFKGTSVIDLYYWTTPNGHKVTICLEELRQSYRIRPVDISKGDQFQPDFLRHSPNNRIPAIVDHAPIGGGVPISVFESGAILLYLAQKSGQLSPALPRASVEVIQWLFWQMGGLGPMLGQNHHFSHYAPEKIPYAIERFRMETKRLYGVLDRRLDGREFIAGEYSIADIACYPWIVPHERQGVHLGEFKNVERWFRAIAHRPAVIQAYRQAEEINRAPVVTDKPRRAGRQLNLGSRVSNS